MNKKQKIEYWEKELQMSTTDNRKTKCKKILEELKDNKKQQWKQ